MSLITLTFNNNSARSGQAAKAVKGVVKVIKTEQFFGTEEVCLIGRLVNGAIASEMLIPGTDKKIVSVESNYGDGFCQKTGAQVVLMVANADKSEYTTGQEIEFQKAVEAVAQAAKPKGKLIIA
jgi:hypothetical protein